MLVKPAMKISLTLVTLFFAAFFLVVVTTKTEELGQIKLFGASSLAFADEPVAVSPPVNPSPSAPALMNPAQFIQGTVMYFLMGLGVFYALYLAPMRKEEDEQKRFISGLKKNDSVLTAGGLLGKVVEVRPEEILVEIASGVKVRVSPSYLTAMDKSLTVTGSSAQGANGSK